MPAAAAASLLSSPSPLSRISDSRLAHVCEWKFLSMPRQKRSSGFIRRRARSSNILSFPAPAATLLSQPSVVVIDDLLHNHVLLAVVTVSVVGQILKPFTSALRGKGFDWKLSISSGGMPSVHSACVTAACTSIALERGMADSLFGLAVVFAAIVMYDAQGVRRAVGKQAKVLNRMILQSVPESFSADASEEDLSMYVDGQTVTNKVEASEGLVASKMRDVKLKNSSTAAEKHIEDLTDDVVYVPLKESVGHTKLEVLVGGLWGVLCTLALSHLLSPLIH